MPGGERSPKGIGIVGVYRTPRSSRKPAPTRANVASGSADVHRDPPCSLELGRR
jgi:hypothetical protein